MDCKCWKDIVAKLKTQSNWAAHVLSTCIDEENSNLIETLKCVTKEQVIENTLFAYEDWSAQPYCDEILFQFDKKKIAEIFEQINNPTRNMKKGFYRFMEL